MRTTAWVAFEHGQTVVTHLNQPSLRIRKIGPAEAAAKSLINYVIEVVNDGSAVAEEVVVRDTLPKEMKYSTSKPGATGDNPLQWRFPRLAPGQKERIELTVILPDEPGDYTSTVEALDKGGVRFRPDP